MRIEILDKKITFTVGELIWMMDKLSGHWLHPDIRALSGFLASKFPNNNGIGFISDEEVKRIKVMKPNERLEKLLSLIIPVE